MAKSSPPKTEDGRYIVVKGRLWRCTNPNLDEETRTRWVKALMAARREVRLGKEDPKRVKAARAQVQEAKEALGERGKVWWEDGEKDYNRCMAKNTPYASWWEELEQEAD